VVGFIVVLIKNLKNMNKKEISVSILDCDFNNIEQEINKINNSSSDYIHIDIMDGKFVPNIAFDNITIEKVNLYSKKKLDYHLMVNDPNDYILKCVKNNANIISVHYEENDNVLNHLISIKKLGCRAGLAINPSTKINQVSNLFEHIDILLLMSVQPGKGGQKFLDTTFKKVEESKKIIDEMNYEIDIEIDGGIDNKVSKKLFNLGSKILVSGSYIIKNQNIASAISNLRD
tara:strand:+ start:833 stop:1525 length:693 start_codon:yes stop_codon:yes gene_type:complete